MDLSLLQLPMIVTSHTYESMSQYQASGISGGKGLQFAASVIIELTSKAIRNGKYVVGSLITAKTRKSRLAKQYQ